MEALYGTDYSCLSPVQKELPTAKATRLLRRKLGAHKLDVSHLGLIPSR